MDRTEAALLGICSVAMRTCRNAELSVGERVLIVGAGILGQVAVQVAAGMGARATICDIDEEAAGDREGDRRGGNRAGCFGGAMDAANRRSLISTS